MEKWYIPFPAENHFLIFCADFLPSSMTAFVFFHTRYTAGRKQCIAALLAMLLTQPLHAASQQITELTQKTLDEKARRTGILLNARRTEVSVSPPPESLRLRTCDALPEITVMTEAPDGPQRLELKCQSPDNWTIYMKGSIDVYADILISRSPLTRGMRPTPENIVFEERNISDLKRGYLLNYQQLENMTAARRIRAGEIIIPSMLEPEQIIQRGDRVNLIAGSGNSTTDSDGFFISMPGEAMNDGALHQQIRVRNTGSGRVVRGTIMSRTEVRVE